MLNDIGHDGSEIVFPGIPDPGCRLGFHFQEFLDVATKYGKAFIQVESSPIASEGDLQIEWPRFPFGRESERRIFDYMDSMSGLIMGRYSMNSPHMVAWDHETRQIFDPSPSRGTYNWDDFGESIVVDVFLGILNLESNQAAKK